MTGRNAAPESRGHQLVPIENRGGAQQCTVCGLTIHPSSFYGHSLPAYLKAGCPGAHVYSWTPWPEGMATKRQLDEKGLAPGPVAGAIWMDKHDRWLLVFRESEATPKPAPSPARQAAIARNREAQRTGQRCTRCGRSLDRYVKGGGLCRTCQDHDEASAWARQVLERGFILLDSETTGLEWDAEPVEIAIVDHTGAILLDQPIRPTIPIPASATAIHGISDADVADAPTFADVYAHLFRALHGRDVVIYNAKYDWPLLRYSRQIYHLPSVGAASVDCAMEWYSQWVGAWNWRRENYRWQPLPGGDHSALGDARATLDVIRRMAADVREDAS